MTSKRRRSLPAVAALVVIAAIAVLAFASASALAACAGPEVVGQGSSLQRVAQEKWTEQFNVNALGCRGVRPRVRYNSTGSGAGLRAWREGRREEAFIGTDDAPNVTELEEMETAFGRPGVNIIPVAQAAIAVLARPPSGCRLVRLRIGNRELEEVFRGAVKWWEQLSQAEAGCRARGTEARNLIVVVHRLDGSGTTYQFKHYLWRINGGTFRFSDGSERTWLEAQGGTANTVWSAEGQQRAAETSGGSGLVRTVERTEGSIGYAALADAAAGVGTSLVEVQNDGVGALEARTRYANPETGLRASNCAEVRYRDGLAGERALPEILFVRATGNTWTNVYGSNPAIGGTTYPICTLTWDLAFLRYETAGYAARTGETVRDYLRYVVNREGGQRDFERNFYQRLPRELEERLLAVGSPLERITG